MREYFVRKYVVYFTLTVSLITAVVVVVAIVRSAGSFIDPKYERTHIDSMIVALDHESLRLKQTTVVIDTLVAALKIKLAEASPRRGPIYEDAVALIDSLARLSVRRLEAAVVLDSLSARLQRGEPLPVDSTDAPSAAVPDSLTVPDSAAIDDTTGIEPVGPIEDD